jgi:hypothetical protein
LLSQAERGVDEKLNEVIFACCACAVNVFIDFCTRCERAAVSLTSKIDSSGHFGLRTISQLPSSLRNLALVVSNLKA